MFVFLPFNAPIIPRDVVRCHHHIVVIFYPNYHGWGDYDHMKL